MGSVVVVSSCAADVVMGQDVGHGLHTVSKLARANRDLMQGVPVDRAGGDVTPGAYFGQANLAPTADSPASPLRSVVKGARSTTKRENYSGVS